MREQDNTSKGVAFVVYEMIEQAMIAIRNLNGSFIFDAQKAIEVKFAEYKP